MAETWRAVVGYEKVYSVSDRGRVRREKGGPATQVGRILKPLTVGNRYARVFLWREGVGYNASIHRLVAAAFIGACPSGLQVNHKNGNKLDNRAVNLEYVTPAENCRHAIEVLGQTQSGENNPRAVANWATVRKMRELWGTGKYSASALGRMFGLKTSQAGRIIRGEQWIEASA